MIQDLMDMIQDLMVMIRELKAKRLQATFITYFLVLVNLEL